MENLPALPDDQINSLIAMALDKQVSVEALERLLAMRRELKAEFALQRFNEAMSAFQAVCPIIRKSKVVPTRDGKVGYRYAPIDAIVSQTRHLIQQHGFSYSIDTKTDSDMVTSMCTVKHVDGHCETTQVTVPCGEGTPLMSNTQIVAAALTFAKRYAFCNSFGILTGDDDNDGKKVTVTEPIDPDMLDTIEDMLIGHETIVPSILKRYKVTELAELNSVQAVDCVNRINAYLDRIATEK
jgi:hypothetical protein